MPCRITGALSILIVLSACGGSRRTSPSYRVVSLPSGEQNQGPRRTADELCRVGHGPDDEISVKCELGRFACTAR